MANPLYDALFGRHAGKTTAFLHLEGGVVLTHAGFLGRAARFAHALTDLGLKPGDRLAVQIDKSADALALYAACVQAGVILLPLNTAYTADEGRYFVTDSGAAAFVCQPTRRNEMAPVAKAADCQLETLGAENDGSFADRATSASDTFETVARDADDLAAFLYTSGTTGRSKGAMLTQANLLSNAQTLAELWRFTANDVLLHALPVLATHGLVVARNVALVAGGAVIFLPKRDVWPLYHS